MEYSEKMQLVPLNFKIPENCKEILKKALRLCQLGYVNDRLNIKLDDNFIENTNVIDYLLENNQKYSEEFENLLNNIEKPVKKAVIYTTVPPRNNKKNKNWIYN